MFGCVFWGHSLSSTRLCAWSRRGPEGCGRHWRGKRTGGAWRRRRRGCSGEEEGEDRGGVPVLGQGWGRRGTPSLRQGRGKWQLTSARASVLWQCAAAAVRGRWPDVRIQPPGIAGVPETPPHHPPAGGLWRRHWHGEVHEHQEQVQRPDAQLCGHRGHRARAEDAWRRPRGGERRLLQPRLLLGWGHHRSLRVLLRLLRLLLPPVFLWLLPIALAGSRLAYVAPSTQMAGKPPVHADKPRPCLLGDCDLHCRLRCHAPDHHTAFGPPPCPRWRASRWTTPTRRRTWSC